MLHKNNTLFISVLLMCLASTATMAMSNEDKGYQIAATSDRSDNGFKDSQVKLQMVLHNAAGKKTKRDMTIKTKERLNEDIGDKSLIIFNSPADIKGTALLSHAKILEPDNQWLYLPALKRIKRISSVNKSGPFVGSEFAFEDFTALELNKYKYKYLRSEACEQFQCDVVERYPLYEYSGYSKQISWIDQKQHQVRKVEFFDRRGDLLKTLLLLDYHQYTDKYWRAHLLTMTNHQTGKRTELIYDEYQFQTGVKDNQFNKSVLKRIR